MSDLELLADTMEEWSTTSGDHHMLAAAAIRQLIKLQAALQSGEPVVPAQWRVVMRGMVEYAECNDPGNPYLPQAQALLSAGKGGE